MLHLVLSQSQSIAYELDLYEANTFYDFLLSTSVRSILIKVKKIECNCVSVFANCPIVSQLVLLLAANVYAYELWRVLARTSPNKKLALENSADFQNED